MTQFDEAVRTGQSIDMKINGHQLRLLTRPVRDASIVLHATQGDLNGRVSLEGKSGLFANLSQGMNQLLAVSEGAMTDIQKTSEIVQEIAAASAEQSESVVQIGGAMGQLSKATPQNASALEQLAAISEELSGQAGQLQQSIAFFKTNQAAARLSGRQPARPSAHRLAASGVPRLAALPSHSRPY